MKNLTTFTRSVINGLEAEGRYGTAHVYRSTLNAFTLFWEKNHPEGEIPMEQVFTPVTLQEFEIHLKARMLKMNTMSTYMRMLRAIYNRALSAGMVLYVHGLFKHVFTGTRADVKRALPPAGMGQVLTTTPDEETSKAQIWFALLFLLRGMPFADLARLRKCDLQDGVITYCRQKTGKMVSVRVNADAEALMKCCADNHPESPYLLDILWNGQHPVGSRSEYWYYQMVLRDFNRELKQVGRALGIGKRLSSYTARHTWATTAFHRKYATGIISNSLGHSSVKVTETYLMPFGNEVLDKTNNEIIAYVKSCATGTAKKKKQKV